MTTAYRLGAVAPLLPLLALVLTCTVSTASAGTSTDTLGAVAAVIVIHRHGARYPGSAVYAADICGKNCGDLTPTGKRMLFSLGQRVQADYPDLQYRSAEALARLGNAYDARRVTSFSTDVARTLQSSGAFVKGLMAPVGSSLGSLPANVSAVLPVTRGRPQDEAKQLLVWTSWPSLVLHSKVTQPAFNAMMAERLRSSFSPADIDTIGVEINQPILCNGSSTVFMFDCLLAAQDIITCAFSNDPVATVHAKYPWMASHFERLTSVMILYNGISMYNASEPFDAAIGTKGFLLGQNIAERIDADIIGGAAAQAGQSVPVVIEYSGHDITLMPFAETIGNMSLTNPTFAAAFVLEVRRPVTPMAPWTVRLRFGEPDQAYGSDAAYSFHDFGLKCTDMAGRTTDADPAVGCSFADWSRFLKSRGPQSPAGICYLPLAQLEAINCTGGSTTDRADEAPSNALCRTYRTECPMWACRAPNFDPADDTLVLNPRNLACVRVCGGHDGGARDGSFLDSMPVGALMGFTALGTTVVLACGFAVLLVCCVKGGGGQGAEGRSRDEAFLPPVASASDVDTSATVVVRDPTAVAPSRLGRLRDRLLRCCCCTKERMRADDEAFFASGTDVQGQRTGPSTHRGGGGGATSTGGATTAHGVAVTVQNGGPKQPKLKDVPYTGTLSPRRRLSFGQSTAGGDG